MCTSIFHIRNLHRYIDLMDFEFLEAVLDGRYIVSSTCEYVPVGKIQWYTASIRI